MKTSALFIITALMTSQLHGATAEEPGDLGSQSSMPSRVGDYDRHIGAAMEFCQEILIGIVGGSPDRYDLPIVSVDTLAIPKQLEYRRVRQALVELRKPEHSAVTLLNLGDFYLSGETNPEFPYDKEKAFKFYLCVANLGYPKAQFVLGRMLHMGEIVPKHYSAAYAWHVLAAAQGDPYAQQGLLENYNSADKQGYIGLQYYHGAGGVCKDLKKACEWFERAATQEHTPSMYNLARLLIDRGELAASVTWFQKASDLGHLRSKHSLGLSYIRGRGVPQDIKKGVGLCQKAAEEGCSYAELSMGWFHEHAVGVRRKLKKARVWYAKAVAQGLIKEQQALARLGAPMAGGAASTAAPTLPTPAAAEAPRGRA